MTLERLLEPPAPDTLPPLREGRIEAKGGVVKITYWTPPADADEMPAEELLNRYLATWNVERDGELAALNADVIHALAPEVKEALREAILGKTKARTPKADEKPAAKKDEPTAHGSFEPAPKAEVKKHD